MIRSNRDNGARDPEDRRCVTALTAKEIALSPFVYVSSWIAVLMAFSTNCRSATASLMMVCHCRRM